MSHRFFTRSRSELLRCRTAHLLAPLAVAAAATAWGAPAPDRSAPPAIPVREATASRRITSPGDNLKPFVFVRPGGGVYLAWAQRLKETSAVYFARSTDGVRFSAPLRLSAEEMQLDLGAESGPQVAADGKGNVYVVWTAGSRPAPRPKRAASAGSAGGHGAHRHPSRPGNLSIYLAGSTDDGKSFSAPRQVNDGPSGPERRFPTLTVDSKGSVFVAWLDKRKQTAERPGYSRVYLARSTDGGRTFRANQDITGNPVDPICHCCKLALASHPTEGLYVAFRNDCSDLRDIFLVHSRDGGEQFSAQEPIEGTRWIVPS
jgi:hypothetical protein